MSKRITSPIKRWAGSVTIADPLTLPQAEAFEACLELQKIDGENKFVFLTVKDKQRLPGVLACVEKWELENFPNDVTLDTFPFSPRGASHKLIEWIYDEIFNIYIGELEVPNA